MLSSDVKEKVSDTDNKPAKEKVKQTESFSKIPGVIPSNDCNGVVESTIQNDAKKVSSNPDNTVLDSGHMPIKRKYTKRSRNIDLPNPTRKESKEARARRRAVLDRKKHNNRCYLVGNSSAELPFLPNEC